MMIFGCLLLFIYYYYFIILGKFISKVDFIEFLRVIYFFGSVLVFLYAMFYLEYAQLELWKQRRPGLPQPTDASAFTNGR